MVKEKCFNCDGTGTIKIGVSKITCPSCNGKGSLNVQGPKKLNKNVYRVTYTIDCEVISENEDKAMEAAYDIFSYEKPEFYNMTVKKIRKATEEDC